MATGMMFIPVGDGIAKYIQAVTTYPPVVLSWARFAIAALILLPWVALTGQIPAPTFNNRRFWTQQCARGALIAVAVTLIIKAVGLSPIADVFGAFFIGPILSVVLAQWLLGVRATPGNWVAVGGGFIGVLLVVQPTGQMSLGILWALAAGCFYGSFLVATRWAAGNGSALAQLTVQLTVAALCLTPFGLPQLLSEGLHVPGWIAASALTSATANLLSIMALSRVGNAVLAPVVYLQIVSASVIGLIVFRETPNQLATIGLILIVVAGSSQAFTQRRG